ncbi:MAG: AAA family ATPase, partial [Acidimicrobiia bacterium]
ADARRRVDDQRASTEVRRGRLGADQVTHAEARVGRESVAEGLRRDADADEAIALDQPRPELDPDVDPHQRVEALAADLRRMGPINPLAAQEYAELEERRSFMAEQLADLESSRAEIRKVISALEDEIERLFLAAFEEVAAAFTDHIEVLFPGGRGEVVLTEPDDLLGSGVDIAVQPLGKKVSRLSLLSGGEKSLAALAFLFAVFKARPSPFYVLDEVEAALDDANLRRFLRLVDAFRGTSQLLIVTHQQQTMEAADVLYGVTMEPGGSSKVVAKRLADQAELPAVS